MAQEDNAPVTEPDRGEGRRVIPALDLRDLIVLVLGNTTQNHDRTVKPVVCRDKNNEEHQQSRGMFNVLNNVDLVPSNVQFSHQEALLYVSEDNEAVIKMIIKGRSPTMRHVSRTHRVALDWLSDRINLDRKIQIKYNDTKNQLAHMLTKGNFARDEWNNLLCLFNISHFNSTDCSEVISKRTQEESGEERVTAKSKPMMNLVSRCSERTPHVLIWSRDAAKRLLMCYLLLHQKARRKPRHESQFPLSTRTEQHHRTGRPVEDAYSSSYSKWNFDRTWSSQEWKSDELVEVRTVRTVIFAKHTDKFIVENDEMDSYTGAESDVSLKSRPFLHRVNDQVRKRQY